VTKSENNQRSLRHLLPFSARAKQKQKLQLRKLFPEEGARERERGKRAESKTRDLEEEEK
jgi:hypothetical protein